MKNPVDDQDADHDHLQSPPPPPPLRRPLPVPLPPSSTNNPPLSPFLIIMFCGLAVSLSFICYLTLSNRFRRRTNSEDTDEPLEVFVDENHGPVVHYPIWLINTVGLEQSEIESIDVFKYKRDEGLIEGTDCSICLSEFEDDESLRLLPKCSHAFHVPCIDTWLRSHKNCPLCRAPIIKNVQTSTTIDSNLIEPSTSDETPGEDSENVEHVEGSWNAEVENDGVEKTCGVLNEIRSSGVRMHSDLADHHRVSGEESVAMRRSVSMTEPSASIVHFVDADQDRNSSSRLKKPNSMPKNRHMLRGSSYT